MNRWWKIGGCVIGAAAIGLYFAFAEKKTTSQPQAAAPEVAAPQSAKPQAAVVLPDVVDVLDIDPLLDPPPIPRVEPAPPGVVVTALDDDPATPVQSVSAPATIPPAVEVDEADEEEEGDASEAADIDQGDVGSSGTVDWAIRALGSFGVSKDVIRGNGLTWFSYLDNDSSTIAAPPRTPLFLDRDALAFAAQYDATYRIRRSRIDSGEWYDNQFGLPPGVELIQGHPLSPLFDLTDLHLMRRLADDKEPRVLPNPSVKIVRSNSVWIPDSLEIESFGPSDALRRVLALGSVIYQVPNSRLDWYTNWHGKRLLPEATGYLLTAKEVRDGITEVKRPRSGEQKQIFTCHFGLFGGPGNNPY